MSQKLKGIYDALDHGNYKNALKLCTAFLQKQPHHALCRALQAAALERCGRRDEALQACGEACSASGVDDTVLSTLQAVYRRCGRSAAVVPMYEAACGREPEAEDCAVALFAAAVREGDFAKAQQAATKLYRKFNKPKYLHWTIISILLQAQGGAPTKVLDLADMMLKKAPVNVEKLKDGAASFDRPQLQLLQLHLMALRLQGKSDQALELIEAAKGFVRLPSDVAGLRGRLLAEAGRPKEALLEARGQLLQGSDNWAVAVEYVRLAFECPAPAGTPPQLSVELAGGKSVEVPDHGARLRPQDGSELPEVAGQEDLERLGTEDEVWNALLLCRLLQQRGSAEGGAAAGRTGRLAELELRRAAFRANEAALRGLAAEPGAAEASWRAAVAPGDLQAFLGLLEEHVRRCGHKSSCYFDLRPFLCLLEAGESAAIVGAAAAVEAEAGRGAAPSAVRLQRAFARPQADKPLEDMAAEVQQLLEKWTAFRGDQEKGEDDSASQTLDELLALAAVALVDLDRARCLQAPTEAQRCALDAVALAELGLAANPRAFHFKVLLVLLYGALGVPSAMLRVYFTMDLKNIQHESLSYLALDALCASGCSEGIREICHLVGQFHEDLDKDGGEALSVAFQSGVLHRVPEYLEFLEQTGRSVVRARAVVEEVLCDVGQAQTWEALGECLGRQSVLLAAVAARPISYWVLKNQDRSLLTSLHPLPLCSPLGTARHSPKAWREGAAVPTTLVESAQPVAATSSALILRGVPAADAAKAPPPALPPAERSAVEELLGRGAEASAGRLRLSASLLQALGALLRREGPSEEQLAEALRGGREALELEGQGPGEDLAAAAASLMGEAGAGGAAPWSQGTARFAAIVRRCAFASCEVAHTVLQCAAAKEPWERAEGQLAALAAAVKATVECMRGGAAGAEGVPQAGLFELGGHGVPWLWALLHQGLAVLLPAALWCSGALPKAGGGKKAKEGQEALVAARQAMRNLLAAVQQGLADLQADLGGAAGSAAGAALAADGGAAGLPKVAKLEELPDFARCRDRARGELQEAHRKHLQALREALGARIALLKSRGPFKP